MNSVGPKVQFLKNAWERKTAEIESLLRLYSQSSNKGDELDRLDKLKSERKKLEMQLDEALEEWAKEMRQHLTAQPD